ncbi:hypothetical protein TYRP_005537 [Tyrophagus putrescentiae]|nr:hypothetical protein TYRP_005537 [Tyrophagus putrescentiae]
MVTPPPPPLVTSTGNCGEAVVHKVQLVAPNPRHVFCESPFAFALVWQPYMDTTFTTTTTATDPPALSISGAPPGSGQSANNGNANSAPPSSGNIDFTYSDTDVHLKD